jgi:endogenous inhibitor of DNA gyrase (YacG/DUF329 family)
MPDPAAGEPMKCPICKKEIAARSWRDSPVFPFCSSRCKLIDLGRWLTGDYRVPAASPGSRTEPDGPAEDSEE